MQKARHKQSNSCFKLYMVLKYAKMKNKLRQHWRFVPGMANDSLAVLLLKVARQLPSILVAPPMIQYHIQCISFKAQNGLLYTDVPLRYYSLAVSGGFLWRTLPNWWILLKSGSEYPSCVGVPLGNYSVSISVN